MSAQELGLRARGVDRIYGPFGRRGTEQVDQNALLAHYQQTAGMDPFLLLSEDWFSRVGFDWHPHRGFETVTYVIDGELEHQDNAGGSGVLSAGDLQWVTTGRGVIHAELAHNRKPVHTLQLWLNLPRSLKMVPPRYQDVRASDVPVLNDPGSIARVYSGNVRGMKGPAENYWAATVIDVRFQPGGTFVHEVPGDETLCIYVITGDVVIGPNMPVHAGQIAWSAAAAKGATGVDIRAREASHIIAYSAKPIGEPVVSYGPFVMNTEAEIRQALSDYNNGGFGPIPE